MKTRLNGKITALFNYEANSATSKKMLLFFLSRSLNDLLLKCKKWVPEIYMSLFCLAVEHQINSIVPTL